MIDINLIRNNKELVKENIRKKFQEHKIIIVDEIEELDKKNRELKKLAIRLAFKIFFSLLKDFQRSLLLFSLLQHQRLNFHQLHQRLI